MFFFVWYAQVGKNPEEMNLKEISSSFSVTPKTANKSGLLDLKA